MRSQCTVITQSTHTIHSQHAVNTQPTHNQHTANTLNTHKQYTLSNH